MTAQCIMQADTVVEEPSVADLLPISRTALSHFMQSARVENLEGNDKGQAMGEPDETKDVPAWIACVVNLLAAPKSR